MSLLHRRHVNLQSFPILLFVLSQQAAKFTFVVLISAAIYQVCLSSPLIIMPHFLYLRLILIQLGHKSHLVQAAQVFPDSQAKSWNSQGNKGKSGGRRKESLTRLSHIRTSPSWLVARQLAFFLFHLTWEAPAGQKKKKKGWGCGKKAVVAAAPHAPKHIWTQSEAHPGELDSAFWLNEQSSSRFYAHISTLWHIQMY